MMDDVTPWLNAAVDAMTYLLNGALTVFYVLWARAPHWLAILAAGLMMVSFDVLAQREVAYAPGRYGERAAATQSPRTAQYTTIAVLALWLAATWSYGPLVPFIGAVMWLAMPVILLVMPQQRWTLLWSLKGYIGLYALAVVGLRLLLWQASALTPAELAEVFGGARSAATVIAQNTGTLATVGTWLLWVIMPAAYFGLALQNMVAQPLSMANPWASAADIIGQIRTRGER